MFSRRLKTGYFALEGLNSFATVYYFYYLYFFMQKVHGFGNQANLMLAALNGATYALMAWSAGKFAQRYGYFRALKLGYAVMIVALSFGLAVRSTLGHIGVMVLTIVGMSFTWPTLEALVSEGEPRSGLQQMVGIYNVVWAATAAVANFSGGAMVQKLGFASLFYVPIALHASQLCLVVWLQSIARVPGGGVAGTDSQAVAPQPIENRASGESAQGSVTLPLGGTELNATQITSESRLLHGGGDRLTTAGAVKCNGASGSSLLASGSLNETCGGQTHGSSMASNASAFLRDSSTARVIPGDDHFFEVELTMPKARRFLRMAWLANPFAYIAINTVIAVVPGVARRLELSTMAAGFCCSTWCFARLAAFAALWRWAGWHYRFRGLLLAFIGLVGSFGAVVLAPNVGVLVLAQLVFGCAVGLIYYSSLFYSMDRSETKGEHGGIHEAVIGLGNCAGPAVGALALELVPQYSQSGAIAVSLLLLGGLGGLLAIWRRKAKD